MIRLLTQKDEDNVLEYLYQEASLNIFIIGDIENFGFDSDFQDIYAEFDEDDQYQSVLLLYRGNVVYYSHETKFNISYMEILNDYEVSYLSGAKRVVDLIKDHLPQFSYKPMYFSEAKELEHEEDYSNLNIKQLQNARQAGELYDFLASIDEFNTKNQKKSDFIDAKLSSLEMGPTYLLYIDGHIACTAATTAETSVSAMVVGVATSIHHRGNGFASKLMTKLMKYYFNEKDKYLSLFYDNPKAGNIYKRLGFKDIDMWVMLVKE